MSSRGFDIDSISCMVCNGHVESNDDIFFTCDTTVAVWNLVRSWIGLPLPSFLSCKDWSHWFDSWHVSKDKKSRMYSIFAATCWTLLCFRNNITFNSHSMRKCDIFDFIRNVYFSWLKYRALLQQIITSLHQEFDMTDLGALNYFLGISATRSSTGLFLSQKKYACELFERANMANCNPSRTLVDTDSKLGPEGVAVQDPTLYRSLAEGLQHLTFTRPDL
nr:ribonuclease H-like domain-containing protein [Tanacetum cinerariifolium]